MAQNNIKVTFNSLYTPDSYKTYVSDNYVPGKVYMLSDKNNNIDQSGKFTEVGIIKKDGVNYSGIVGIANGSNNIVGTGKSNGYIVHLNDGFKLWFWLDEYNLLHVDTEGTMPNEWIGENPGALLTYTLKQYKEVTYNITSKYGVPKVHIIGTNNEYVELADTGNNQEIIHFDNEGSSIELKYIKNTIPNSHECQLTFIFPEDLTGFDVEKSFIYSVEAGKNEEGLDYEFIKNQSKITLKLIEPKLDIKTPKETINEGDSAEIILRTNASQQPGNMIFSLTNATIDTSNGYVALADHDSQFFIQKFDYDTVLKDYYAIIKFTPGNTDVCRLNGLFGNTNPLENTNNYKWSVIQGQGKDIAVKPSENVQIENYTATGITITSVIDSKHPGDILNSGTIVGTVVLTTGYYLKSNKCTLGGIQCTIEDNNVKLDNVFTFGTNNPSFGNVNPTQIQMTIKAQGAEGNNGVAKIEGLENSNTITYAATASKTISFTPNADFNINDATITVTVDNVAFTEYTTTTSSGKLNVNIKRSICANSANDGKEIIVTVAFAEIKALGYYSFEASSLDNIKNLTSSDFTKISENVSEPDCGKTCYPVVLTTGTTAPIMTWWSVGGNGYGAPQTMDSETDYSGLTITINDKIYNVWCLVNPTLATDTTKVKIEIK